MPLPTPDSAVSYTADGSVDTSELKSFLTKFGLSHHILEKLLEIGVESKSELAHINSTQADLLRSQLKAVQMRRFDDLMRAVAAELPTLPLEPSFLPSPPLPPTAAVSTAAATTPVDKHLDIPPPAPAAATYADVLKKRDRLPGSDGPDRVAQPWAHFAAANTDELVTLLIENGFKASSFKLCYDVLLKHGVRNLGDFLSLTDAEIEIICSDSMLKPVQRKKIRSTLVPIIKDRRDSKMPHYSIPIPAPAQATPAVSRTIPGAPTASASEDCGDWTSLLARRKLHSHLHDKLLEEYGVNSSESLANLSEDDIASIRNPLKPVQRKQFDALMSEVSARSVNSVASGSTGASSVLVHTPPSSSAATAATAAAGAGAAAAGAGVGGSSRWDVVKSLSGEDEEVHPGSDKGAVESFARRNGAGFDGKSSISTRSGRVVQRFVCSATDPSWSSSENSAKESKEESKSDAEEKGKGDDEESSASFATCREEGSVEEAAWLRTAGPGMQLTAADVSAAQRDGSLSQLLKYCTTTRPILRIKAARAVVALLKADRCANVTSSERHRLLLVAEENAAALRDVMKMLHYSPVQLPRALMEAWAEALRLAAVEPVNRPRMGSEAIITWLKSMLHSNTADHSTNHRKTDGGTPSNWRRDNNCCSSAAGALMSISKHAPHTEELCRARVHLPLLRLAASSHSADPITRERALGALRNITTNASVDYLADVVSHGGIDVVADVLRFKVPHRPETVTYALGLLVNITTLTTVPLSLTAPQPTPTPTPTPLPPSTAEAGAEAEGGAGAGAGAATAPTSYCGLDLECVRAAQRNAVCKSNGRLIADLAAVLHSQSSDSIAKLALAAVGNISLERYSHIYLVRQGAVASVLSLLSARCTRAERIAIDATNQMWRGRALTVTTSPSIHAGAGASAGCSSRSAVSSTSSKRAARAAATIASTAAAAASVEDHDLIEVVARIIAGVARSPECHSGLKKAGAPKTLTAVLNKKGVPVRAKQICVAALHRMDCPVRIDAFKRSSSKGLCTVS